MIIISDKPGQLGNLLFLYANFLAYGYENKIKIHNPSFYPYLNYFESTSKRSLSVTKAYYNFVFYAARFLNKFKIKLPFIYVKCLNWDESLDLDESNSMLKNSSISLVQGWAYRGPKTLDKHKLKIRGHFKPKKELSEQIDSYFKNTFDLKNEIIIAFHLRRGDFKNYDGGKYFYSFEEYAAIIERCSKAFAGKQIHFLVSSNEKIPFEILNPKNYKMSTAPNHELMDMYCLARANYIVGPPSTYSMWASFYGEVPLCTLFSAAEEIAPEKFRVFGT